MLKGLEGEDKVPIVVESDAVVWNVRESVYNSSSSLHSASNLPKTA